MISLVNLKRQRIWVLWKNIAGRKLPFQPSGQPAKANDPSTWSSYEECSCVLGYDGIGFEIAAGIAGIDLDWKKLPGAIPFVTVPPYADDIVHAQKSYTEWSPSGLGLHIICTRPFDADDESFQNHDAGVEVYHGRRYFTLTERRLPETPAEFTGYDPTLYSKYRTSAKKTAGPGSGLVVSRGVIPDGTRNRKLYEIACGKRGDGMEQEDILREILDINEKMCQPPKSVTEVMNIVRSACKKPKGVKLVEPESGSAEDEGPVPELTPWTIGDLVDATLPERKCFAGIAKGAAVFTSHSINQIFAFRGTGKTLFQFALGLSLAGGKNFLCYTIPCARKVLYIEGELPDRQIQERIKSLGFTDLARTNMLMLSRDRQLEHGMDIPSIHTLRGRAAIERLIEQFQPEILFLDSMSSLLQLGTNEEDSWLEVLPWFTRLRSRGLCIILTQQTGKDQTRGNRGHSRAEDPLDVSIQLTRRDEECEYLNCTLTYSKFRAGSKGVRPLVIKKQEGMDWEWSTLTDEIKKEIRAILEKNSRATANSIHEQVGGSRAKVLKFVQEVKDEMDEMAAF